MDIVFFFSPPSPPSFPHRRKALRAGGSSMRDFINPESAPGYFQTQWKVYGHAGELCKCGGQIKKITQSARATYYCPRCQR
ncbi:MAG: hypothetical protein HAW59_05160 [Betaproteobacteria bacterium]|nr:hypothetical protein [Betaproteobacteria bacterium]